MPFRVYQLELEHVTLLRPIEPLRDAYGNLIPDRQGDPMQLYERDLPIQISTLIEGWEIAVFTALGFNTEMLARRTMPVPGHTLQMVMSTLSSRLARYREDLGTIPAKGHRKTVTNADRQKLQRLDDIQILCGSTCDVELYNGQWFLAQARVPETPADYYRRACPLPPPKDPSERVSEILRALGRPVPRARDFNRLLAERAAALQASDAPRPRLAFPIEVAQQLMAINPPPVLPHTPYPAPLSQHPTALSPRAPDHRQIPSPFIEQRSVANPFPPYAVGQSQSTVSSTSARPYHHPTNSYPEVAAHQPPATVGYTGRTRPDNSRVCIFGGNAYYDPASYVYCHNQQANARRNSLHQTTGPTHSPLAGPGSSSLRVLTANMEQAHTQSLSGTPTAESFQQPSSFPSDRDRYDDARYGSTPYMSTTQLPAHQTGYLPAPLSAARELLAYNDRQSSATASGSRRRRQQGSQQRLQLPAMVNRALLIDTVLLASDEERQHSATNLTTNEARLYESGSTAGDGTNIDPGAGQVLRPSSLPPTTDLLSSLHSTSTPSAALPTNITSEMAASKRKRSRAEEEEDDEYLPEKERLRRAKIARRFSEEEAESEARVNVPSTTQSQEQRVPNQPSVVHQEPREVPVGVNSRVIDPLWLLRLPERGEFLPPDAVRPARQGQAPPVAPPAEDEDIVAQLSLDSFDLPEAAEEISEASNRMTSQQFDKILQMQIGHGGYDGPLYARVSGDSDKEPKTLGDD
ncbi:hypothetical protein H2199_004612 [Coniosporium tulheliwenetii]|uniref:Uncharacterized protein n=1 Tax=Coniosporium tulheliwenetii TaxID=3383036 RepID=A0ACC2Z5V9_9PEZI|nr:hypothetical protein H2199_004612 [Cladosporium sp. JES 115]